MVHNKPTDLPRPVAAVQDAYDSYFWLVALEDDKVTGQDRQYLLHRIRKIENEAHRIKEKVKQIYNRKTEKKDES